MRTCIYVDGYNLYYGRLRGTGYKWLDVVALFSDMVWRIVEKKTDVNLALSMYRDANRGLVEQVVLVSNDSDAEPTLSALRQDFPELKLGVVMPLPHATDTVKKGRPASSALQDLAHWCRTYIRDDELARAQLPVQVPTRKKPARKPAHW